MQSKNVIALKIWECGLIHSQMAIQVDESVQLTREFNEVLDSARRQINNWNMNTQQMVEMIDSFS